MKTDYDIVIVGAGMVGLVLAKLLAESELSVAVLDRNKAPTLKDANNLRVSAISRASQHILSHLGCWNDDILAHACAYDSMHVWDDQGGGQLHFHAADLGEPDIGHIIPNNAIRCALWKALESDSNIQMVAPTTMQEAQWHDSHVELRSANDQHITARLAVAADGANSWLRQQSTIGTDHYPYDHHAIVATVACEYEHNHCARQSFLETGPLALLPLRDPHQCSIVWSTSPAMAKNLTDSDSTAFNQQLSSAFGDSLGNLSVVSERVSYPLLSRHVTQYIDDGLALVGDAAHTIHPLAGQGVNLGFLDAACLAQIIEQTIQKGLSFYAKPMLRPYERWRRSENQLVLDAMFAIKSGFAKQPGPLGTLRSMGMDALNKLPIIKSHMTRLAMGLDGDLPKVAKAPIPEI